LYRITASAEIPVITGIDEKMTIQYAYRHGIGYFLMDEPAVSVDYRHTPTGLTGHVLERDGCPLHYWLGGPEDRPLVVLMHGGTLDHRMFNPQVAALLPSSRVLVWDCRGHGQSQPMGAPFSVELAADDMLAILAQEGIDRAVLGGQSLGGMIAQQIYLQSPGVVQALLMIDSASIAKAYSRMDVLATRWTVPLLRFWPYNHLRRTTANAAVLDPAARDYAYEAMGQMSHADFLQFWRGVAAAITTTGIPGHRIDVPVLLVHGDKDRNGTIVRDAQEWANSLPVVTYHVVPDAAHNANQDNPGFVNRVMLEFLAQHAS
jgi:pimeloyl-ACP methyl ester carboxylesterase